MAKELEITVEPRVVAELTGRIATIRGEGKGKQYVATLYRAGWALQQRPIGAEEWTKMRAFEDLPKRFQKTALSVKQFAI